MVLITVRRQDYFLTGVTGVRTGIGVKLALGDGLMDALGIITGVGVASPDAARPLKSKLNFRKAQIKRGMAKTKIIMGSS